MLRIKENRSIFTLGGRAYDDVETRADDENGIIESSGDNRYRPQHYGHWDTHINTAHNSQIEYTTELR